MSKCPRPIQKCEPQVLPSTAEVCPDWSVCLPWGGRLYQTEGCVRYEPGTPPPDGVYGLFTLKDGCFIKAEEHPSDVYHPDPCAPVPCPCDSEGEGSGNLCNPSTAVGNLYSCDAAGKPLVKVYIEGQSNITVTGNATLGISGTVTAAQTINVGEGGATVEVNPGSSLTMSTGFGGDGTATLTKAGGGTLTLGADNKIGRLVISSGVVNAIENGRSVAQLPSVVEFRGGTLYDPGSEGSYSTNNASFEVPGGYVGVLYTDPRCEYNGKLTGAGTFTVYATGVRGYFKGDWSAFSGTLIPGLSQRGSWEPSFDFANGHGLPHATMQLNSGVTFRNTSDEGTFNVAIGQLTGEGTLTGNGTYTIGGLDQDIVFYGQIESPVEKVGAGKWSVFSTTPQNNIGAVTINGGQLYFDSFVPSTLILNNSVTVNTGELRGNGMAKSIVLNNGAVLEPGLSYVTEATGYIGATENLTINQGAVVKLHVSMAGNTDYSHSYIKAGALLTLNGEVQLTLGPGYQPSVGDEITLWSAPLMMGTPTVTLPQLPEGYVWDKSALNQGEGKLVVRGTEGISSIAADAAVSCRVYTLSGVLVAEYEATGATAEAQAASHVSQSGTYVLRVESDSAAQTIKVNINLR